MPEKYDPNTLWVALSGYGEGNLFHVYPRLLADILLQEDAARVEGDTSEAEKLVLPSDKEWRLQNYFLLVSMQKGLGIGMGMEYHKDQEDNMVENVVKTRRPDEDSVEEWAPWNLVVPLRNPNAPPPVAVKTSPGPAWDITQVLKAARLLCKPPLQVDFSDEQDMRCVYSVIYDVFRCLDIKRKWSNCRDYYKKDKQKLKSCPTGSAAKKGKRYVYADILSFLDKVVTRRNHDGNYEEEENDELSLSVEDTTTRNIQKLEDIKPDNAHKKNTKEESKPKKKKTQDVPGELLNILRTKTDTTPKDYDDDEKYLLSFYGDMKKMTHLQKIDFKLGIMQLLKNIFNENGNIGSRTCSIDSIISSPQSTTIVIPKRPAQPKGLHYNTGPAIFIPRPTSQPQGFPCNTDPSPRLIINSIETISSCGKSHAADYAFDQSTGSDSQTEESFKNECKTLLDYYLSFK